MGARALVVKSNHVLLVRHTYQKGWCTIGGGVEKGESPQEALIRELKEEAGITVTGHPELFAVYHHIFQKRDDYVAFYIVRDFEEDLMSYSLEIAKKKWFSLDGLPDGITPATQRRIEEFLGKAPKSERW